MTRTNFCKETTMWKTWITKSRRVLLEEGLDDTTTDDFAGKQSSVICEPRGSVGNVIARGDMPSPPSDVRRELERGGLPSLLVESIVSTTPFLDDTDLRKVIPNGK
jgi:hypothetical protein